MKSSENKEVGLGWVDDGSETSPQLFPIQHVITSSLINTHTQQPMCFSLTRGIVGGPLQLGGETFF